MNTASRASVVWNRESPPPPPSESSKGSIEADAGELKPIASRSTPSRSGGGRKSSFASFVPEESTPKEDGSNEELAASIRAKPSATAPFTPAADVAARSAATFAVAACVAIVASVSLTPTKSSRRPARIRPTALPAYCAASAAASLLASSSCVSRSPRSDHCSASSLAVTVTPVTPARPSDGEIDRDSSSAALSLDTTFSSAAASFVSSSGAPDTETSLASSSASFTASLTDSSLSADGALSDALRLSSAAIFAAIAAAPAALTSSISAASVVPDVSVVIFTPSASDSMDSMSCQSVFSSFMTSPLASSATAVAFRSSTARDWIPSRASTRAAATSLASIPATLPASRADARADEVCSATAASSAFMRSSSATDLMATSLRSDLISLRTPETAPWTTSETRGTTAFAARVAVDSSVASRWALRAIARVSSRSSMSRSAATRDRTLSLRRRAPAATKGSAATRVATAASCMSTAAMPPPAAPNVAASSITSHHGLAASAGDSERIACASSYSSSS